MVEILKWTAIVMTVSVIAACANSALMAVTQKRGNKRDAEIGA
jgi:hypothetical protein